MNWRERFAALKRRPAHLAPCAHPTTGIRAKETAAGVRYATLCLTCGAHVPRCSWIRKADLRHHDQIPLADAAAFSAYWTERSRAEQDWRQAERAAWWDLYNDYLDSPEWRALRDHVVARDRVCRRCGGTGEVVHHITYERVGAESPADLFLLCTGCHDFAHQVRGDLRGRVA